MTSEHSPERIEASFRYGSTIIIGALAGFSLAFLTAWVSNPIPWSLNDIFSIVPLVVGVGLQLIAVWQLLDPRSLELAYYRRIVRFFRVGLVLVLIGSAIAIGVDYLYDTSHFQHGGAVAH